MIYYNNFKLSNKIKRYADQNFEITPIDQEEFNLSKERIIRRLKSEIARQFWDQDGFYKVFNRNDLDVKAVLQGFE